MLLFHTPDYITYDKQKPCQAEVLTWSVLCFPHWWKRDWPDALRFLKPISGKKAIGLAQSFSSQTAAGLCLCFQIYPAAWLKFRTNFIGLAVCQSCLIQIIGTPRPLSGFLQSRVGLHGLWDQDITIDLRVQVAKIATFEMVVMGFPKSIFLLK